MFFDSQPNFYYPYKDGIKLSKNLFRRVRFRDNLNALYVASTRYTVQQGETPEQISTKQYGSPEWYWTILILNNIIDVHNDWPVSDYELDLAIEKQYGDTQDDTKFWETKEVYEGNNLVLEGGVIIEYNEGRTEQQSVNYYPSFTFKNFTATQLMNKVTNREFEYRKNEEKKEIFLIKPEFLTTMQEEIQTLFAYDTEYKIDKAGIRFSENS
jgi:hypothetical protein